jgi:CRP-like cAMP-binding protein
VPVDLGVLRDVPLFAALSDEELNELAPLFNDLSFVVGHAIANEGRPGFGFFVIESGSAKVTVKGEERGTLGPGSYFGEIALLDQGPRVATVTAESDLTAHVLSPLEFRALVTENPTLALPLLAGLWRILGLEDVGQLG